MRVLILLLVMYSLSFSFDKVSLGVGFNSDVKAYEVSAYKDLDYKFYELELGVELSYAYVRENSQNDLHIAAITPMLTYNINESWYIDGGIGASYVSEKTIANENLGMHFQFRDFIGVGYHINEKFSVDARFIHYSNADLDDNNSGLDLGTITARYRF